MACDLTAGRLLPCKDVVGGIQTVFFIDYGDLTNFQLDKDEIINGETASTISLFRYDLKGASSLEQAITSSPDNGTTFFEQTLTLNLQKLTKEDMLEFKLIAYGRPLVIVMDNNDNFFLAGKEHGMSVSGGSITTGASFGDMSGTTLTLSGQEKLPANFINGATFADPLAGLSDAQGIVVAGTNS